MRKLSLPLLFSALLMGAGFGTSGCTAVLDFTECTDDEGCSSLGAGWTCVNEQCVEAAPPCTTDNQCTTAPNTSCVGGMCVPPDDMTDMTDMADMAGDMADVSDMPDIPTTCLTHEDCRVVTPANDTLICGPAGMCVDATTAECPSVLFPDGIRDNLVFVGSILPLSPPFDVIGIPLASSIQLAVQDFNAAGGLPDGRKIAWVSCNSLGTSTVAQTAATHLTGVVGVPAIVGPVFSTPFIEVTTNVTRAANVFTISPTATSPNITGLPDDNLAWRVIPSDVFQGNAIVDRVTSAGWARVVVLAKNDAYGNGLLSEVSGKLTTALGAPNVYVSNYEDPTKLASTEEIIDELSMRASGAIAAMPDADAIIFIGTTEAIDLFKIYQLGLSAIMPMPTPMFLFSHGVVPSLGRTVEETSDLNLNFVEGITPNVFDEMNFAAFNLRYRARFNDEEPISTTSLAYDSAFVVLFAMSALPDGMPITGSDLAGAMSALVDESGLAVSFGDTSFISDARNELASGGTVDLQGVSGELDFDLTTGDIRADYIGWMVEKIMGQYVPTSVRVYILNMAPAEDGTWMDLP